MSNEHALHAHRQSRASPACAPCASAQSIATPTASTCPPPPAALLDAAAASNQTVPPIPPRCKLRTVAHTRTHALTATGTPSVPRRTRSRVCACARTQNEVKPFLTEVPCGMTLSTLKRTVLLSGRHWPIMTLSPVLQRKHGEMCAGVLLCRFSYLKRNAHLHTCRLRLAGWCLLARKAGGCGVQGAGGLRGRQARKVRSGRKRPASAG